MNQRWAAFEPKYALLYAEAAKPRGERSVPNTNDWYNAAGAVIAAANAASGVVSNEIHVLDPNIRSEERRVGKMCSSSVRARWPHDHTKKQDRRINDTDN